MKKSTLRLKITDNAGAGQGLPLNQCTDFTLTDEERLTIERDLEIIGGKRLCDILENNPQLLVFPQSLGAHKDGIENLHVCSYNKAYDRLCTGNLMGFVGVNDTQLSITSRFAKEKNDNFLHYMLIKVFCPNLFKFLHETSAEHVFDFLLYMFPNFLNKALNQGIFREYRHESRNDIQVKGKINLARHLQQNIPFKGNVAYDIREHSLDNHITQLVRHTIEHIKSTPFGRSILNGQETQVNIRTINEFTPSYIKGNRRKIIFENRFPVHHPYFTKYTSLQRLCLSILRHEEIKYGTEKDKIYGILFDGAWLWEEYLNTIFTQAGIIHAENKTGKNPIYPLTSVDNRNKYVQYPDFYIPNQLVIDAKYKHLGSRDIANDDIHQIISYLHVLKAQKAFIAFPNDKQNQLTLQSIGFLKGFGGEVGKIGLKIPHEDLSFDNFGTIMREEETILIQDLKLLSQDTPKYHYISES